MLYKKKHDRIEGFKLTEYASIDTPALIVNPAFVKSNIELLISMINDVSRLRPHIKTHKTREAIMLMIQAGICKFKSSTIAETELLGMCQASDVLLAYQPNGPKLSRFIELIKTYPKTKFSCLIDSLEIALNINELAQKEKLKVSVFIDLNVGMNRTGIEVGEKAIELFKSLSNLTSINFEGFHAYDGHIRERDLDKRIEICETSFLPVEKMVEKLIKEGFKEPKLIMGGSPSFPFYSKKNNIECSPGTFIFWDVGYQKTLPEQKFTIAALLISRIISLPTKNKLCLDLGYKSIASENVLENRLEILNIKNYKVNSQSEEHLVIEVKYNHNYKIGDLIYIAPVHICPTCAVYDFAWIVEEGLINDSWEIVGRKRMLTI